MIHALRAFNQRNWRLYFCGQSFLPEMVPAREDLPSAIAFNDGES
jgi:hypothetical protein